jgi:isoquinoline 1-oxidoreductase beta subunit
VKKPFAFQPLGGFAVVADTTWAAMRGRAALDVTWAGGENATHDSRAYRAELTSALDSPGRVGRSVGDADAALARAKRKVEATYHVPHLAHASMEPPVAVARIDGDRCEIWAPTQSPDEAREEVAKALGIDKSQVTVHVTMLGGAFGRKAKHDFVIEAALAAKAAEAPVRLQWTRDDDLRHDYYHTTCAQRLVAGLDDAGKLTAWRHRTAFPPIGSTFEGATFASGGEMGQGITDLPLAIPNVRAENCPAIAHTRIGWLRSVSNINHAFAVQSFIDEIAHARGVDPKDNLLDVLGPARIVKPAELGVEKVPNYGQPLEEHPIDTARHRRVLERATDLSRWSDRKRNGRALGLAVHRSFLTYVAVVVSVARGKDERIGVDEVWIVADAGRIVNLERVRAQLEGAVIFALSHALYGEITMKDGATEQKSFRDYRLMRIAEAPRQIHTDVIASDRPAGGVGEPGVPPVAPALTNALFALTGQRVRELPVVRSLKV